MLLQHRQSRCWAAHGCSTVYRTTGGCAAVTPVTHRPVYMRHHPCYNNPATVSLHNTRLIYCGLLTPSMKAQALASKIWILGWVHHARACTCTQGGVTRVTAPAEPRQHLSHQQSQCATGQISLTWPSKSSTLFWKSTHTYSLYRIHINDFILSTSQCKQALFSFNNNHITLQTW